VPTITNTAQISKDYRHCLKLQDASSVNGYLNITHLKIAKQSLVIVDMDYILPDALPFDVSCLSDKYTGGCIQ